jgi:hypothetical protein
MCLDLRTSAPYPVAALYACNNKLAWGDQRWESHWGMGQGEYYSELLMLGFTPKGETGPLCWDAKHAGGGGGGGGGGAALVLEGDKRDRGAGQQWVLDVSFTGRGPGWSPA